jgi:hypothetical protein
MRGEPSSSPTHFVPESHSGTLRASVLEQATQPKELAANHAAETSVRLSADSAANLEGGAPL